METKEVTIRHLTRRRSEGDASIFLEGSSALPKSLIMCPASTSSVIQASQRKVTDRLPDEIVLEIFRHLMVSLEESFPARRHETADYLVAAMACAQWYRCARSVFSIPGIYFRREDIIFDAIADQELLPDPFPFNIDHLQIALEPPDQRRRGSGHFLERFRHCHIRQLVFADDQLAHCPINNPWGTIIPLGEDALAALEKLSFPVQDDFRGSQVQAGTLPILHNLQELKITCVSVNWFASVNDLYRGPLYYPSMPALHTLCLLDEPFLFDEDKLCWGCEGDGSIEENFAHHRIQQKLLAEAAPLAPNLRHLALTNWQQEVDYQAESEMGRTSFVCKLHNLESLSLGWTWTTRPRWTTHTLQWMADLLEVLPSKLTTFRLQESVEEGGHREPMWLPFLVKALERFDCFAELEYFYFQHPRTRLQGTTQVQDLANCCLQRRIVVIENGQEWWSKDRWVE